MQPGAANTNAQPSAFTIDRTYLRSYLGGVFRLAECVLDLLVIITASINLTWLIYPLGGGWVEFVAVIGVVGTAFLFFINLFSLTPRMPTWWSLAVFCYTVTMSVFYGIAFIVAAVRTQQLDASVGVCAAFAFLALVAYCFDAYLSFRAWRSGTHEANTQSQPSAVVVTNNVYQLGGQPQAPAHTESGTDSYNANSAWDRRAY